MSTPTSTPRGIGHVLSDGHDPAACLDCPPPAHTLRPGRLLTVRASEHTLAVIRHALERGIAAGHMESAVVARLVDDWRTPAAPDVDQPHAADNQLGIPAAAVDAAPILARVATEARPAFTAPGACEACGAERDDWTRACPATSHGSHVPSDGDHAAPWRAPAE